MADPGFTEYFSFGILFVVLSSTLASGGVRQVVEMVNPGPLPEFSRNFNVVVSSDGSWDRSFGEIISSKELLPRTASSGVEAAGQCRNTVGQPLMELIAVIINDIDQENPGNLYGTIEVVDRVGRQSIYDRDESNWEYIYPGNHASITGPPRAITGLGTIAIHLDLWDRDFTAGNSNDQIVKHTSYWGDSDANRDYDRRVPLKIFGDRGAVTLDYIVFCDAVAARIDVTLIQGSDGVEDEVFGTIGARIGSTDVESLFFNRDSSNYIQLRYNKPIPLIRTVVAVPVSSFLHMAVKLYDRDFSSENDEIAAGCARFPPKTSGTEKKRINGESGEIEVKVTWGA